EKPADETVLGEMRMSRELLDAIGSADEEEDLYQASMGIYVFNRQVLIECLENNLVDFGKDVIPNAIKDWHVSAFIYQGYWEDIGTIRAFYKADRKSTRLNPSHGSISYAVFCLKKKKKYALTITRYFIKWISNQFKRDPRRSKDACRG